MDQLENRFTSLNVLNLDRLELNHSTFSHLHPYFNSYPFLLTLPLPVHKPALWTTGEQGISLDVQNRDVLEVNHSMSFRFFYSVFHPYSLLLTLPSPSPSQTFTVDQLENRDLLEVGPIFFSSLLSKGVMS